MAKNVGWDELDFGLHEVETEDEQKKIMYVFIDETDMDVEDVYSLVFMKGRKITWQ